LRIQDLMGFRYDATPLPLPTDDMADDAEKIVQWFLECAFFKPFVYRNPMKDPQKEFCRCFGNLRRHHRGLFK
jgi:hypothetical protein